MLSPPGEDPDFPGCSADPRLCLLVWTVLSCLANPFVLGGIWPWVFCPRCQALLFPSYSGLLRLSLFVFSFAVLSVIHYCLPKKPQTNPKIGIFLPVVHTGNAVDSR